MRRRTLRLVYMGCLAIGLLVVLLHYDFFKRPFHVGHDTPSYTNMPGIEAGISLSNFSSTLRTPGYSLFFFLATGGQLPNSKAISYKLCGDSVFANAESCETARPESSDVVVRADPVVYGYTHATARLLNRTAIAAKLLFLFSLLFLFWALSGYLHPFLAAAVVALVCAHISPTSYVHLLDVLQSESLFPGLLFLYISCIVMYMNSERSSWLLLSSALSVYIFFVRPVFLYLIIFHLGILTYILLFLKHFLRVGAASVIIAIPVGWVFLFSPNVFFSTANSQSALLRTAVLSDDDTVSCVKDPKLKTLLAAYMRSIYEDPNVKVNVPNIRHYLDKYYVFAFANSYRVESLNHPIYKQTEIRPFLDQAGALPEALIEQMLEAAGKCNFWRSMDFMLLTTKMILGISPVLTRFVPRNFFNYAYIFYISSAVIISSVMLLLSRRQYGLPVAIMYCVVIYLTMVLIVALKQGGEGRYTDVVEPLFVLAAAMAAAVLLRELSRWLARPFAG